MFDSPLHSDASKEYFIAAHLGNEFILSLADQFLTEQILFCSIENSKFYAFRLTYFAALMRSRHLSERIISAALWKMVSFDSERALEFVPDIWITSEVIDNWLDHTSWTLTSFREVAALRVKQAHPEYEGFPDDWVLDIFCGK